MTAADDLEFAVRVRPGASRESVGGAWDGPRREGDPPAILVSVRAKAVEGAATAAVIEAVADALGVRPSRITLVSGATSRDKRLRIANPDEKVIQALDSLRK